MNKIKLQYLFFIIFSLLSITNYSYGKDKGPPHPKPNDGPGQPGLPIDGGASILLGIGAAYGIYKLKKKE